MLLQARTFGQGVAIIRSLAAAAYSRVNGNRESEDRSARTDGCLDLGVEANVGINVPMETLRKQLDSRTQTFEGALGVSAEMVATLNGPAFKIDAVTPEQQTIAEGFPTVWSWNVEAKQEGEQELEATLYALAADGNTFHPATCRQLRSEDHRECSRTDLA